MNIAIFGAGGLGREIHMLINYINNHTEERYNFIGWFDDSISKGEVIDGYPVLGGMDDLNTHNEHIALAMGLGDSRIKLQVLKKINNTFINFPNLIHPSVNIKPYQNIKLGEGVIIQEGCILTTNIVLKSFVFLNLNCTVGHDTTIEEFSSFMPAVNISGEVKIGKANYFGTNATILNTIETGEGSIIGAGACVSKSLDSNSVYVGIPAKKIRSLDPIFD